MPNTLPAVSALGKAPPSHRRQKEFSLVCVRAFKLPMRAKAMITALANTADVWIRGCGRLSLTAWINARRAYTFCE